MLGCKRDAEKMWEPMMNRYGSEVPVCWHHNRLDLWWYRRIVFCKDEEEERALP